MKYDLNKKPTKFAVRVLKDLSDELFNALTRKHLESITVNEICEATNYPRATFYNYFNDIYDLLDYCFYLMTKDINLQPDPSLKGTDRVEVLVSRVYDYLDAKRDRIEKYLEFNPTDGLFVSKLHSHTSKVILDFVANDHNGELTPLQSEIIAEHVANTCQLIFKRCFDKGSKLTKDQAIDALRYLVGNL